MRVLRPGKDGLSSVVSLLSLFEQTGYAAERIVRTIDNQLTGFADGWTILMTTFVDGVPLNHSADALRQLGMTLGRLHALPTHPNVRAACRTEID